ncbi:MAG: GGDEF domain-containing protein [Candidatus Pacearchaeota archaeon]|nr:GGDEF domain-containing protein [Candidatus Pacearchaeota archaeon]
MDKKLSKKMHALDPRFRKKIEDLFSAMNESVSMLYEAATHDEKTGLYNNKFFESMLEMELEKAGRGQKDLCLFIIDVDFFKKVNDTHGHIKADEFLKRLADILKKQLRKTDIAARFGGEEFFIILPQTSFAKSKNMTLRLRNAIKSDSVLKKYGITVSGGLTCYAKGDTKKKIKERADKALYKAKQTGRDKFVAIA